MKKKIVLFSLISVLGISSLVGCGNSAAESYSGAAKNEIAVASDGYYEYSDDAYSVEADYEEVYDEATEAAPAEGAQAETVKENAQSTKRKLIRNVDMEVETEDFDSLLAKLENKTNSYGGYIENSNVYNGSKNTIKNRNASLTIRIPSEKLDEFLENVAEQSNITNKSESVTDVTLKYVDMKSHKDSLEVEYKRLTELLEQADDIDEIIYIESRMTDVRYQIESMESQLRTYDNLVDYSTINMTIREVKEYTPEPEEEKGRLAQAVEDFCDNVVDVLIGLLDFIIGIIVALPYLLVWAVIIFVIVKIVQSIIISIKDRKDYVGLSSVEKRALKKEKKAQRKADKKALKEYKKKERAEKKNKKTAQVDNSTEE